MQALECLDVPRQETWWWPGGQTQVVVRAVDAGDTYLTFRPLVPGRELVVHRVPRSTLEVLLAELARALPDALPDEVGLRGRAVHGDSIRRAVQGALTCPVQERDLSRRLGSALVPPEVWALLARSPGTRLRITPSARLAKVPWELLISPEDGHSRLLALAELYYELPPTIHYRRPRAPWSGDACRTGPYRTIDPEVDPQTGLTRVLDHRGIELLRRAAVPSWPTDVTRADLSQALRNHPTRWLYVGHVTVPEPGFPGSAGLHLSDARGPGVATFAGSGARMGLLEHRALTTLDLLVGTQSAPWLRTDERLAAESGLPGYQVWPMPPRVALIACNSGADHTATEPLGLIAAAHFNGAEFVTSTRWALPTDEAFRQLTPKGTLPTSDLVVAVDAAHEAADLVGWLRRWQLGKLAAWETDGDLANCPLICAALTTHHAPARRRDGSPLDWPILEG